MSIKQLAFWGATGSKSPEDYWKNVDHYDPFEGVQFNPEEADDIVSKVAKGKQGN